jgi:hypothetical protein
VTDHRSAQIVALQHQIRELEHRLDRHRRGLWLLAKIHGGGRLNIPYAVARHAPAHPTVKINTDPTTESLVIEAD